jgi:hypothetical protein
MKKFSDVFAKFWGSNDFRDLWNYFSLRKICRICPHHRGPSPPAPAHRSMDFIKGRPLATGSTARMFRFNLTLGCHRLFTADARVTRHRSVGWGSWRIVAEHGGSPEFKISRATVVGFQWGLLLRDHSDKGNVFMLTLIDREWQRSPTTVRRLGRCLSTVRVASSEALAPRMCAKASLSSLLASRPTNCFDWCRKSWIWWLPRVRRVLDLWPKICTICSAIYKGF